MADRFTPSHGCVHSFANSPIGSRSSSVQRLILTDAYKKAMFSGNYCRGGFPFLAHRLPSAAADLLHAPNRSRNVLTPSCFSGRVRTCMCVWGAHSPPSTQNNDDRIFPERIILLLRFRLFQSRPTHPPLRASRQRAPTLQRATNE